MEEEINGDPVGEILEKEPEQIGKKRSQINPLPKHLSKKMKHDELYKPPSSEEMNELKEAETMYHSSLFRFQIEELLGEVKLKAKYQTRIQSWLDSLKLFLKNLPASDTYKINDHSWLDDGIKVPILQVPKNKKGHFQFLPPLDIYEIGSYNYDTICTPEPRIDIAIKLPKKCFQKFDYLNHLYLRKRALYLAYLAKLLKGCDLIEKLEYFYHNDCHLKPGLVVYPKGQLGKHFSACLFPFPENDTFKLIRFIPQRNNIRPAWFYGVDNENDDVEVPTPYYNSCVLEDLLLPDLNDFLKSKITSQSIKDAIILLKVWCIQRFLYGGSLLNGFTIGMIITYLLQKKKINALMSSYQIFRNALLVLKNENWLEQGATLCINAENNCPSIGEFHGVFDTVFVDSSGYFNICYMVTKDTFLTIQHEVTIALNVLDRTSSDSFALLFINRVPFCRKYEYLIHFSKPQKFKNYSKSLKLEDDILNKGGDLISSVAPKLCELIKKGLKDRVLLVNTDVSPIPHWDIFSRPFDPNTIKRLTIGLLLNQDHLLSNIEKGPLANDPQAKEFLEFWGKKSELRRFKDGSIHEAVFWPAETIQEKRTVLSQMISYIFERHANMKPSDVHYTGYELDIVLTLPKEVFPENFGSYGTGEEMFFHLQQSYNKLVEKLRRLNDLPLTVTSVQGTSAAFRFTDVFPPFSRNYPFSKIISYEKDNTVRIKDDCKRSPTWVPPLEVIIHLEGSGKWPDDIEALRRIKAALHIKLSELLKSQFKLNSKACINFVDVLMDGYVFRIVVATHKEITLLKQIKTPEGMTQIRDNEESRKLECLTEILTKLNSILHGLQQQHNIFGTACRLAKRWVSSQLLSDYVNDIVVELIMSHVFITPEPFTCPNTPQIAFQRFLALLAFYDWTASALIVNLNNGLTEVEISDIQSNFTAQRTNLPPLVIVMPLDKSGTLWTKHSPNSVIATRLIKLAQTSLETFEKQLFLSLVSDFKQIFRPPLLPYNVLIHLNKEYIPKALYALDINNTNKLIPFKKYHRKMNEKIPVIDFDPVQLYLKDLRDAYNEFALFFYDNFGGSFIAVVWKPDAFISKSFKISHINGHMITDGTKNILPNVEAIVTDFSILGSGLVKNIEITDNVVC